MNRSITSLGTFTARATKALAASTLLLLAVTSCKTPKDVTYFQDLTQESITELANPKDITVRPDDRVSIIVVSKDPQLASLFNAPLVTRQAGQTGTSATFSGSSGNNQIASYVVDNYGDIQFPVLGTIHIGGMRRSEVAEYIQKELINRNLVKDPTVLVDFLNHGVSVLGDVNHPGRVTFDRDRFTIIDAIAGAGDLSLTGRRTDVLVLRNENGRQKAYRIDLTDAQSVMNSPVFYLQQDDVVYVSPIDVKKRQATANGNTPFTPAFWISIGSMIITIVALIIR